MNTKLLLSTLIIILLPVQFIFGQNSNVNEMNLTRDQLAKPNARGSRGIFGSMISMNGFSAGTTNDTLYFIFTLNSPDFEYGDSISMTFPAGFTVVGGQDSFALTTEGQSPEYLNLPINSPTIEWGDNDNNYGGIEPTSHYFYVVVNSPVSAPPFITVSWFCDGDLFGPSLPHFTSGTVNVTNLSNAPSDMEIVGNLNTPYYSIPEPHFVPLNLSAEVSNNGGNIAYPTTALVNSPAASYSSLSNLPVPFTGSTSVTTTFSPAYNPSGTGTYELFFNVIDTGDIDTTNNSDTATLIVSDNLYTYTDSAFLDGSLSIGGGSTGIIGSLFDIVVDDTLTEVRYFNQAPDATVNVSFVVFEADSNGPTGVKLWESDTFNISSPTPQYYSRLVNLPLSAGERYLIGIREDTTGGARVGRDSERYFADRNYAFFLGSWFELGSAGFPFGLDIEARFAGTNIDLANSGGYDYRYYYTPLSQISPITLSSDVTNIGAPIGFPVKSYASIPLVGYADSVSLSIPIASGSVQSVSFPNLTPTTTGHYEIFYDVPVAGDMDLTNNSDTSDLFITDSVMAYTDSLQVTGSLGIGAGSSGVLGMIYEIHSDDTLTSVRFYNVSPDTLAEVSFVIYQANSSGPVNTILWESDTFTTSSPFDRFYERELFFPVVAGEYYFIGVRELNSGSASIGTDPERYQPNSAYTNFFGGWTELGTISFPFALNIDAIFGVPRLQSCSASFTFVIDSMMLRSIQFTDQSAYSGPGVLSYQWDFGDGNISILQNPSHLYGADSTYSVCLTISDSGICTDTVCQFITILDSSVVDTCQAAFAYSIDTLNPYLVNFADMSMYNGTGTLSYNWSFGDGNGSMIQDPAHTYAGDSLYTVCLSISDGGSCADSICQDILIVDTTGIDTCIALFTSMPDSLNAFNIIFTDATVYNGSGVLNYSWDFGDGGFSVQQNPVHMYSNDSTYNVCLSVTDGLNCNDIYCDSITINDTNIFIFQTEEIEGLEIYPNPATEAINIEVKQKAELDIFTLSGERVHRNIQLSGRTTVSTDKLSTGVYLFRIQSGEAIEIRRITIIK
ncbi:MAG TPA: hypothetical protein DDX92_00890 [Flavobacteriales bacterium]|jgi:PKD repeat protein|nr:hypothetical protein [Flavobacteriales bacterium]